MWKASQKQQQQLLKQQRAFEKWLKAQKAKKDKGQPTDPAFDQLLKMAEAQQTMQDPARRPNRRGPARKSTARPKPAVETGPDDDRPKE